MISIVRCLAAALVFAIFFGGCASQPMVSGMDSGESPDRIAADANIPLLLISLDGVHPAYLERGLSPNLSRIAQEGVKARWMRPSYPSLTFPNHYTLVTGLRPDRHGIVHNTMRDPALGEFFLSKREAVSDARWWGGEPLWVTLEKSGRRTATMFCAVPVAASPNTVTSPPTELIVGAGVLTQSSP